MMKVNLSNKRLKYLLLCVGLLAVGAGLTFFLLKNKSRQKEEAPTLALISSNPSTDPGKFYLAAEDIKRLDPKASLPDNKNFFPYHLYSENDKTFVLFKTELGIQRYTFSKTDMNVILEETRDLQTWLPAGSSTPIFELQTSGWNKYSLNKPITYKAESTENTLTLTQQTIAEASGKENPVSVVWQFGVDDDEITLKNTFKLDGQETVKSRMIWRIDLPESLGELPQINQEAKRVELGGLQIDWSDFAEKTTARFSEDKKGLEIVFFEGGVTGKLEVDPTFTLSTGSIYFGVSDGTRKWCFTTGGGAAQSSTSTQFWQPGRIFHTLGGTFSLPSDCIDAGAANENVITQGTGTSTYDYLFGENSSIGDSTSNTMRLMETTATRTMVQTFRDGTFDNFSRNTVYPVGYLYSWYRFGTLPAAGDSAELALHCPSGTSAQTYGSAASTRSFLISDTSNNNFPGTSIVPFSLSSLPDIQAADTSCATTDWAGWYENSESGSYIDERGEFQFLVDMSNYRATTSTMSTKQADYANPDDIRDGMVNAEIWDDYAEQALDASTGFEEGDSNLCSGTGDGFDNASCTGSPVGTAVGNYSASTFSGQYAGRFTQGASAASTAAIYTSGFSTRTYAGIRLAFKILTETLGNNQDITIASFATGTSTVELQVRQNGSGNLVLCVTDDTVTNTCGTTTLSTNTWYQAALYQKSNASAGTEAVEFYLDGVLQSRITGVGAAADAVNVITIGVVSADTGANDLLLDDVVTVKTPPPIVGFNPMEGAYTAKVKTWSDDVKIDLDTSNNTYVRQNPTLLLRGWKSQLDPAVVKLEERVLINGTDYNADVLPFTEAWMTDSDSNCGTSGAARMGDAGDTSDADEFLFSTTAGFNFGGETVNSQTCIWGDSATDRLLFGRTDRFSGMNVLLSTAGSGSPVVTWEYCSANTDFNTACDTWSTLTVTDTDSGASTFTANGNFYFTPPSQWLRSTENSGKEALFYVRSTLSSGSYSTYPEELKITPDILAIQYVGNVVNDDSTFTIISNPGNGIANWNMDEGSGSSVYDLTGNSNTLTVSGATRKKAGGADSSTNRQSYLSFDGSNDFLSRTDDTDFRFIAQPFTITGWFRSPNAAAGLDVLVAKASAVNGTGYKVYMDSNENICFGIDDDTTSFPDNSACTTVTYNDSKWHHFGAVRRNSSLEIWVDGALRGSTAITSLGTLDSSSTLYIGIDADGTSNPWQGDIDNVVIYPYALTASQMRADVPADPTAALFGSISTDPITNGLAGFWKFDESSLNSCTGGSNDACDSSGNGIDGAYDATMATSDQQTGRYNLGVNLDGSNDEVSMGDSATLEFTGGFTVSAWVYRDTFTTEDTIIAKKADTASSSAGYALVIGAGDEIRFYVSDGSTQHSVSTNTGLITAVGWNQITAVFNPTTTSEIFLNGVAARNPSSDSGGASGIGSTANAIAFNVGATNTANPFDGRIDSARVYSRALSRIEVESLYNWAPSPIGWWKLDENTGSSASDSSDSGVTGTLGGNTTWITGVYGSGAVFDGTDDSIDLDDNLDMGDNTPITVSLWFYPTSDAQNASLLNKKEFGASDVTGAGFSLIWFNSGNGGNTCFYVSDGSAGADQYETCTADNATATLNRWYHIEATYDNSGFANSNIYLNGVLAEYQPYEACNGCATGISDIGSPANSYGLCLGNSATTSGNCETGGTTEFNGRVDDVKIYNYVRTQKQILEDMNGGHPAPGSPIGSYTSRWKFDDMESTTAQDSTDSNNDLTLSTESWTSSGKFGGAWNGTGSIWLSRADDSDFDYGTGGSTSDFSVSAWAKSDSASLPAAAQYITRKFTTGAGGAGFALYFNTSGQIVFDTDDDGTCCDDSLTTTESFYDGNWHHIVAVRNLAQDKNYIFVDGKLVATDSDLTSTGSLGNSALLYVGDDDGDSTNAFAGDLDEVKFFALALGLSDVQLDMNYGSSSALGNIADHSNEYFSGASAVAAWTFDENTGTSTSDRGGTGQSGTFTGNVSFRPGKHGTAVYFDGTGDYITASANNPITETAAYTVTGWVYPADVTDVVFVNWSVAGIYTDTTPVLRFCNNSTCSDEATSTSNPLTLNQWNHIAVVYNDGGTATIYVNAVDVTSDSSVAESSITTAYTFGRYVPSDNAYYTGMMDEFKFYNYALTQAQVRYDMDRGAPIGWWKLDESSGSTAYDASLSPNDTANGNNGTTTGSPTFTDGKLNNAVSLNGTSQYVTANDTPFDFTGNFTVEAWVNRTSGGSGTRGVVTKRTSATSSGGFALSVGNSGEVYCQTNNGSADANSYTDLNQVTTTSGWTHLAIVRSGASCRVYVNGTDRTVTVGTHTTMTANNSNVVIGAYADPTQYWYGLIDNVKIYNYAMNANQVKKTFTENSGVRFGPASGNP